MDVFIWLICFVAIYYIWTHAVLYWRSWGAALDKQAADDLERLLAEGRPLHRNNQNFKDSMKRFFDEAEEGEDSFAEGFAKCVDKRGPLRIYSGARPHTAPPFTGTLLFDAPIIDGGAAGRAIESGTAGYCALYSADVFADTYTIGTAGADLNMSNVHLTKGHTLAVDLIAVAPEEPPAGCKGCQSTYPCEYTCGTGLGE